MRLAEKLMLQSCLLLDYDWKPLNWNPCWLLNVCHHYQWYEQHNKFCSNAQSHAHKGQWWLTDATNGYDKSFANDFLESKNCTCWKWFYCYDLLRCSLCFWFVTSCYDSHQAGAGRRQHWPGQCLTALACPIIQHPFVRGHGTILWCNSGGRVLACWR